MALGGRQALKGAGGPGCLPTKRLLKPGYCLTLLSEPSRKPLWRRPADGQSMALGGRQAAKGAGGPGCCLPKGRKGRRDTFKARVVPNVAFWTHKRIAYSGQEGEEEQMDFRNLSTRKNGHDLHRARAEAPQHITEGRGWLRINIDDQWRKSLFVLRRLLEFWWGMQQSCKDTNNQKNTMRGP